MNNLWDSILTAQFRKIGANGCKKTPRSDTLVSKCCKLVWTGIQSVVAAEPVWHTVSGHVVDKPCDQAREEVKKHGTINCSYGKNTVVKVDYYAW